MTARFILSLDCEGKWGVADHLTAEHDRALGDQNLRRAYSSVVATLTAYDVPATFAFVGCFTRSLAELRQLPLAELSEEMPYLQAAAHGVASGAQGWSGAWAVDMVADRHEIALHGVTHVPWTTLTEAQAKRELQLTPGLPVRTFIYPRNLVAHTGVLADAGFCGYRAAPSPRSRWESLISEFDAIFPRSQAHARPASLVVIPAGFFLNWRHGARRLVPSEVSRMRARTLLEHAVRTGGVVHYWAHPENFATAPDTLAVLDGVLAEVVRLRDAGHLQIQTQEQYCASVIAGSTAEADRGARVHS